MAARKSTQRSARTASRKSPSRKPASRRPAARKATARKSSSPSASSPMDRKVRPGFISHTEIASADPAATKEWAVKAFGWKFGDSMPMPDGSQYHMWQFKEGTGGGIRPNNPPETPGTVPYVEVSDIKSSYDKALKAGASEMMAPMQVPGSGGWIAIVKAPGGPAIGLWGMK